MKAQLDNRLTTVMVQAIKIAVGSSVALFIAMQFDLDYAVSAGTITMLTIMTTKVETLRLSAMRLLTFLGTAFLSWMIFGTIRSDVFAFGLFLLLLIVPCHLLNVQATVPVNVVIATHFLSARNFSAPDLINEFLILIIGISIASLLNLIFPSGHLKKKLQHNIHYTEEQLQKIFDQLTSFLHTTVTDDEVWGMIENLESHLHVFREQAHRYKGDSLKRHSDHYVLYVELRQNQCSILKNLRDELCRLRSKPVQAGIIADFMVHIRNHIKDDNDPELQLRILYGLLQMMKKEELPQNREEFEARAILYHILISLEQFLLLKRQYLEAQG